MSDEVTVALTRGDWGHVYSLASYGCVEIGDEPEEFTRLESQLREAGVELHYGWNGQRRDGAA